MIRRILWLSPIVLMAGYAFWGWEFSDYQRGYKRAAQDAERLRQRYGWVAEAGASTVAPELFPVDDSQSERWQAGYRQALQDYLRNPPR